MLLSAIQMPPDQVLNLCGINHAAVARHLTNKHRFLTQALNGKSHEVLESGSFECLLLQKDLLYPEGVLELTDEPKWSCQDKNLIYNIDG